MEQTLVKSSFLRTTQAEDESFKIAHIISGRQFVVDQATVEVLDYFKEPQLVKEEELSTDMSKSLKYMIKGGMLVELDKQLQETYHLKLSNNTLYGFKEYNAGVKEQQVVFIGVPFGSGNPSSSYPKYFPEHLRRYISNHNLKLNGKSKPNYQFLGNNGEIHHLENLIKEQKVRDAGDIFIHHYESRKEVYSKIEHLIEQISFNNKIPFSIGGDHSISYPIISALAKNNEKFNVLHFDAHTDIYSSSYEKILDKNGLHHHGNFVSKCLELPQLNKYYQFGIRGINNAFHKDEDPKLEVYWAGQLKSMLKSGAQIELPEDEKYYITFDIDVMDPSVAPGTATPIPGGFFYEEALELFERLGLKNKNIIGIDFVEVNKQHDIQNLTTALATQLILNLLNCVKVK